MYCEKCGQELVENTKFCPKCGTNIINSEEKPIIHLDKDEKEEKLERMKWFDTKEIKNEASLSVEQISYLEKPSLTIFGPLNIIFRKHWDFFLAGMLINLLDRLSEDINYIIALLFLGFTFYFYYFTIANGRRLAWNRNRWESFEKFQESERKWMPWGVIVFIILILVYVSAFLVGVQEGISGV